MTGIVLYMKMRELPIVSGSATSAEQMVAALRKLADEIENHTVIIEAIDVSTALRSQEVIRQKVSFELLLVDPKTA